MYKSCVEFANQTSDCFEIYNVARHGENLFPVLCCMFLNDLNDLLLIDILKLLTLLYVYGTVIFTTNPVFFQRNLNILETAFLDLKLSKNGIDSTNILLQVKYRRLSLPRLCIARHYRLRRLKRLVPIFFPICLLHFNNA